MTSTPDDTGQQGPRFASLLDQMADWFRQRTATHTPPQAAELRIPAPFAPTDKRTP